MRARAATDLLADVPPASTVRIVRPRRSAFATSVRLSARFHRRVRPALLVVPVRPSQRQSGQC